MMQNWFRNITVESGYTPKNNGGYSQTSAFCFENKNGIKNSNGKRKIHI